MAALPTLRAPAQTEISSWSPTFVSRAHSMKTQRRQRGAGVQRWKVTCTYGTMEPSTYADLWGFLVALRGQYTPFTITLPSGIWPRGTWGGTPLVNGAVSAGASSIAIDGLTPNITGIGKRGDFLKLQNSTKIYMVPADFDSNGSGQATVPIFPNLLASVADNETVTVSSIPMNVILTSDEQALSLQPPVQGTLSFSAIEEF